MNPATEDRIELRYLQWAADEARACGVDPYSPTDTRAATCLMDALRASKLGQHTRDAIALEEYWSDLVTAILAPFERLAQWLTRRLKR